MAGHESSHRVGSDRGWSGRVEDEALLRGGPLRRRRPRAKCRRRRLRALAPRASEDSQDRLRRGAEAARRRGGADVPRSCQALCEATVYDPDSGQALAGSFMDYAMPRADDVPAMTVLHREVVCKTNPLGVKGTGEAGTTAAPCALVNAIANALPREAAAALQMPVTSQTVWRALQGARDGRVPKT